MEFSSDRPCLFINPDYRPMGAQSRPVIDPATLEVAGAIAAATEAEIDAALTAAANAQKLWKALDAKTPRETSARRRQRHRGGRLHALRRTDGARDGQALSGGDRRDRQLRADLPLLCRDGARRGRQDRRHHAGGLLPVCALRALRRVGAHHALQLPDPADVLDGRRLARGRQRLHHQAGRGDDALDARLHAGVPVAACGAGLLPAGRRGNGQGAGRVRPHPRRGVHRFGRRRHGASRSPARNAPSPASSRRAAAIR